MRRWAKKAPKGRENKDYPIFSLLRGGELNVVISLLERFGNFSGEGGRVGRHFFGGKEERTGTGGCCSEREQYLSSTE